MWESMCIYYADYSAEQKIDIVNGALTFTCTFAVAIGRHGQVLDAVGSTVSLHLDQTPRTYKQLYYM